MGTSSLRRAGSPSPLLAWALTLLLAAPAWTQTIIGSVPDPDQPPPNQTLLGCLDNFCGPTAAAAVVAYWDAVAGHDNAVGVTASLTTGDLSQYLSWFMATNSEYDISCSLFAGTPLWGRTQARTGQTSGTVATDIGPGLFEYSLWDGVVYPLDNPGGPAQPGVPLGKRGYRWRVETKLAASYASDSDIWNEIQAEVNAGRPTVISFEHWHLTHVGTANNVEYFDWDVDVDGTNDANFTTDGYTSMETPPTEEWNEDNLGHAVTGVGYHGSYDAGSGVKDWVIVHDNWPSTGQNVAVPFVLQTTGNPTAVTSVTIVEPTTEQEPDVVVDSSGVRHVVWWDGTDKIYYKNNAMAGNVGVGTQIKTGQDPAIAIDPGTGHLYVAFRKPGPFINDNIYVTDSSNGASWSSDALVSDPVTCGACREPTLTVDSGGNVHVAWEDDCDATHFICGDDWEIYANSRTGMGWGTPVQVTVDGPGTPVDDRRPDLGSNGSNVFLAHDRAGDVVQVRKATLTMGSASYPTPEVADQAASNPVRDASVVVDAAGDAHVLWADRRSGSWEIFYQARHSGTWLSSDQKVHATGGNATAPDLALTSKSPGADLHTTWEEESPLGTFDVQYKMITNNGSGVVNTTGSSTNQSSSALPSLAPAIVFGGTGGGAAQLVWTESVHLIDGQPLLGGYFTPVIPPLLAPIPDPTEGVPFDVIGYAQPFGTGQGPAAEAEVQIFVDGLPHGVPVFPQTDGADAGRFVYSVTIPGAGVHEISGRTTDLPTAYMSEISPPRSVNVPEPAGWLGLLAGIALLRLMQRRRR